MTADELETYAQVAQIALELITKVVAEVRDVASGKTSPDVARSRMGALHAVLAGDDTDAVQALHDKFAQEAPTAPALPRPQPVAVDPLQGLIDPTK